MPCENLSSPPTVLLSLGYASVRHLSDFILIKFYRPILLNCSSFKLQILQLLLSLLWNFSWFKKPNDPLLTSRWRLLKCLSFKKNFASEKGILSELEPKQDSRFWLVILVFIMLESMSYRPSEVFANDLRSRLQTLNRNTNSPPTSDEDTPSR